MPITADFHMHSSHSGDSSTPMEQMIQQAIQTGMTQMCFTEHQDFDYPSSDEIPADYFLLNTDAYLYDLIRLRQKYEDKIRIFFGVELGLQPHLAEKHERYVDSFDFDFVIGSSHVCHDQDPYYPSFFEGRSDEEAYMQSGRKRKPIGNISSTYWKISAVFTISMYTAIWTMSSAMGPARINTILMTDTGIYSTPYWNCCWSWGKVWSSIPEA